MTSFMTGVPRPLVAAPAPWVQPRSVDSVLPNGIRLHTLDMPGQRVVSVRTVHPLSLADEAREHEGVSVMMTRLLDEGAGDLDPEAFALALERHGAALGAGVTDGGLTLDLDVPLRHLEPALHLMTSALAEPRFPDDEVRRVLRNRVAEYEHESASAPHRAARELLRVLWSGESRAARPTAGTPETIGSLDRSLIAARHATVPSAGSSIVIAGDLREVDVDDLLGRTVGEWRATGAPIGPILAPQQAHSGTRVVIVDRPGSVQSELAIGCPGPDRSNGEWAAYPVLSYLLGGSPGARIDAVLREDKGYTYGIRASARPRIRGGSFVISGSVRSEVTAESLGLLMDIVEEARSGFGAAELATGVDFHTRATPGRWATAEEVADQTSSLALEGLPPDFPQRTMAAMLDLVPADLDRALSRLGTDGWAIVVVADAEKVRADIEALDLGPVSVVPV